MVEYEILGPLTVRRADGAVVPNSARQRILLALLLLGRARVIGSDRLIEELWADEPPHDAAAALRNQVSRLRRLLGPAADDLVARSGGYCLHVERAQLDSARFEDSLLTARQHEGESLVRALDQALALWRGRALAEIADRPFARPEALRLEELRLGALEQRAEVLLALGSLTEGVASLEALIAAHPERERARGLLMAGLYRQGRQTEALSTYRRWRRHLASELGLDPSPTLQRLERDVLRHTMPAPPSFDHSGVTGPQTFLFSDIEGSTRRWHDHPDTMPEDLTHHDNLLRLAIDRHGGTLFKHTGDGGCAVFASASAALRAAVAAQQALHAHDWGAGGVLRVRMAVHTGPAHFRAGDWFGPTLNRAARLMRAAHGGQIVVSLISQELALDDIPAGLGFRDLGEHRLADLDRPERIFQVTHPDLPDTFEPLRSLDGARHNLPIGLSPFVGRRTELAELARLIPAHRLLTIVGAGGAGKTRLAIEAGSAALAQFGDGVFLVELAPVKDPALVPQQAAVALGMAARGGSDGRGVADQLLGYLESRRVLLLLDNCEHVVGAAAALADALLTRCSGVAVLATSREPLGVHGEMVWRIPPLSFPSAPPTSLGALTDSDAGALLCRRAGLADAGMTLTGDDAATLASICRRLDGLPLALELAAARLRVLTPQELLERLDDRFRLLSGGARTALPHHQTLRAAMDWSYHLLSGVEQAVLRRLAVFPAGFSVSAAESVVADSEIAGEEVLDHLGRLVDKSLVVVERDASQIRFRLLETVRQYCLEQQGAPDEFDAARRRHRDFFLASAESTHGDLSFWWDTDRWLERVRADEDDYRAAVSWSRSAGDADGCLRLAVGLSYYWVLAGGWEDVDCLAWAVSNTRSHDRIYVRALCCLAFFVDQRGDRAQAATMLRDARTLGERIGDPVAAGFACELLGVLEYGRGEFDDAEALLREARRRFEAGDCVGGTWGSCYDLGWLFLARGDTSAAAAEFERAVLMGRRSGSADLLSHSLAALAPVAAMTGQAQRAEALASEAVALTRDLGLRLFVVMALNRSIEAAILLGEAARAESALRESLDLLHEVGGQAWHADTLELVALFQAAQSCPQTAARLLGAAQRLNDMTGGGSVRAVRAEVERCRADLAATLGAHTFGEEWTRGHTMSVTEAIGFARALFD